MIHRCTMVLALALLSFIIIAPRPSAARGDCQGREPETWETRIASDDEPGDRLVVSGRLLAADGESPIAGATVFVFHTDARGYYSEEGMDESNARLCGLMLTDDQGRFRFETIKPAHYATGGPPAHIHFRIWGQGPEVPRQSFVLNFEGDPLLGQRGQDASKNPTWATIRPVSVDEKGVLHVSRDLRVR